MSSVISGETHSRTLGLHKSSYLTGIRTLDVQRSGICGAPLEVLNFSEYNPDYEVSCVILEVSVQGSIK